MGPYCRRAAPPGWISVARATWCAGWSSIGFTLGYRLWMLTAIGSRETSSARTSNAAVAGDEIAGLWLASADHVVARSNPSLDAGDGDSAAAIAQTRSRLASSTRLLASRMHSYSHDRLRLRAEIGLSGSSRALVELLELAGDFHELPTLEAPLPRARTACLIPTAQTIAISPLPDLSSLALIEVSARHYPPRHSRRGRSSKGIARPSGIFCSRPRWQLDKQSC